MNVLSARNLQKSFGNADSRLEAVKDVSLDVRPGEALLVAGPSGSGKTTLLTMLGCMQRPDGGEILIQGIRVDSLPQAELTDFRLRRIGFIFQTFRLIPSLSAVENVELVLNLAGVRRPASRSTALGLLEELGVAHRAEVRSEVLSGGEKQRVAIARALALDPVLILADEPTGSLDGVSGRAATGALVRAAKQKGAALIVVSHDTRIEPFMDRAVHMEDGRIAEEPRANAAVTTG